MAALPFVFLTNGLDMVASSQLQTGAPPPTLQITKYFFKPHIEAIKREFYEVKVMGTATAEEWLKGLDDKGKLRKSDAARWERWDASGGVLRMRTTEPSEILARPQRRTIVAAVTTNAAPNVQSSLRPMIGHPTLPNKPVYAVALTTNNFNHANAHPAQTPQPYQVPFGKILLFFPSLKNR